MATHSSVLAWRIPGTEEPSGLPSTGSHRVGHDSSDLAAAAAVAAAAPCISLMSFPTLQIPLMLNDFDYFILHVWNLIPINLAQKSTACCNLPDGQSSASHLNLLLVLPLHVNFTPLLIFITV